MNHLEILRHYGIRAQKSLWQNFLVNDNILETISDSIDITWKDILEIGPGYGALTEKILERKPKSLTLIELDKKMTHILYTRIAKKDIIIPSETIFTIIEGDVLKYVPWKNNSEISPYSIIANIPYYITSPILFRFLHELGNKPEEMIILIQKEVGDKICKKKWYNNSYLSLALEFSCKIIKEICLVEKTNFIPAPKIDSSVLYFQQKEAYNEQEAREFLSITSAWFSAPRKKLLSNLANILHIPKEVLQKIFLQLGFLETARAEELDIKKWKELIKNIEQIRNLESI